MCNYWKLPDAPGNFASAEFMRFQYAYNLKVYARIALSGAFVCVQVLFLLLFLAYRHDGSPYGGSSWVVQVAYQIFLWILAFLYQRDADDLDKYNRDSGVCSFLQSWAIVAAGLASVGMTIMAVVDVAAHPG